MLAYLRQHNVRFQPNLRKAIKVQLVTHANFFSELYSIFETVHIGKLVEPKNITILSMVSFRG
jgi:hypothetical protein